MASDTLTLPPLLVPELSRGTPRASRSRKGPSRFPVDIEERLEHVAREAMRLGVEPVLASARSASRGEAEAMAARGFQAFVTTRRQIWPLLGDFVGKHPLVLLRLLGEVARLAKARRLEIPLPTLDVDQPAGRALLRLSLGLRTYEMTMALVLRSVPSAVQAIASRGEPAEFSDEAARNRLLERLDTATARLEFGAIVGVRLLERRRATLGPTFELAGEYAASGADEQYMLLRGLLRTIIGEEPRGMPGFHEGGEGGEDVPPEALVAEWIRAVLAA